MEEVIGNVSPVAELVNLADSWMNPGWFSSASFERGSLEETRRSFKFLDRLNETRGGALKTCSFYRIGAVMAYVC